MISLRYVLLGVSNLMNFTEAGYVSKDLPPIGGLIMAISDTANGP